MCTEQSGNQLLSSPIAANSMVVLRVFGIVTLLSDSTYRVVFIGGTSSQCFDFFRFLSDTSYVFDL